MALTAAICLWASFFDRGMERGVTAVRSKPTRFAADFIQALLPSALIGFDGIGAEGVSSLLVLVVLGCLEEERVGVMKCGDLDLAKFSFSSLAGE